MSTCPICSTNLVTTGDMREDGRLQCPLGCYCYEHSYGNHEETYSDTYTDRLNLRWNYTASIESMLARAELSQAFVKYVKNKLEIK